MPKQLLHLAAGGTIDSHWDGSKDTAVPNRESAVPDYLQNIARIGAIDAKTMYLKDSREISIRDQDDLAAATAETSHDKVLVTIGTYLMPDVATSIASHPMATHFEDLDRRVVLTGSVVPLKGFLQSDAGFNLGMAVAILETNMSHRVMVVMSGGCFKAGDIRKDLSNATFSGFDKLDRLGYHEFDLITVGGSIDFVPDGFDGMVSGDQSIIPGYLRESVRMRREIFAVNPFVKDSRNLAEKDMETMLKMVRGARTNRVVVTTGIYKMRETAKYLENALGAGNERTIILTGSRIPLGITDKTDAPFNLGYTLGKIGFTDPGVYIAMNGSVMKSDDNVFSKIYTPEELNRLKKEGVIQE